MIVELECLVPVKAFVRCKVSLERPASALITQARVLSDITGRDITKEIPDGAYDDIVHAAIMEARRQIAAEIDQRGDDAMREAKAS